MTQSDDALQVEPGNARIRDLLDDLEGKSVLAVVLFGSVARGDHDEHSDLDVLVLIEDEKAGDAVMSSLRGAFVAMHRPIVWTTASLLNEAFEHPSFVAHLLDEGMVLGCDPTWNTLKSTLRESVFDSGALAREVQNRAKDLEPLFRTERFQNSPVTALSHIYGIARSVVIARLLQEGIHEYSWQRAFDRYAEVRPDLAPSLKALKDLRPYYAYARARSDADIPSAPVGTNEMRELANSVAHLAE